MLNILLIKGDGIGIEVIDSAKKVLEALNTDIKFSEALAGYKCFLDCGTSIPDETVKKAKNADAVLFGAVTSPPNIEGYQSAILALRKKLDLFANVRPIRSIPVEGTAKDLNFVVVRENTEGLYSGAEKKSEDKAVTERIITRSGSEKIVKFAFDLAEKENRKKVTVVHKANVLRETCGLFLSVAQEVSKNYPNIEMEDRLVDSTAMQLIKNPSQFDVIVTTNMFGDILSDEASALVGGLGVSYSGNIGNKYSLFEPVHGSAPKYEGKNMVNPIAAILSASLMLTHLGMQKESDRIKEAVKKSIKNKITTKDLGGTYSMVEVTDYIIKNLT